VDKEKTKEKLSDIIFLYIFGTLMFITILGVAGIFFDLLFQVYSDGHSFIKEVIAPFLKRLL
jgi:hypothetical protein